jgi:hypothetical protein
MVLDSVESPHTRRNYAKALDDLFQFCTSRPLTRALSVEWREGMEALSPSTIMSRSRPCASWWRGPPRRRARAGSGGQPDRHPQHPPEGTRLGNWLTREQAKELLAVPDRST